MSSAGVQALCGEGLRERPAFPIRKCVDPTSNLGLGCKPLGEKPYAPSDLKKDVGALSVAESECKARVDADRGRVVSSEARPGYATSKDAARAQRNARDRYEVGPSPNA